MARRIVLDRRAFFREIGHEPHAGQWLVHDSEARFRVMACGVRFGKCGKGSTEVYDLTTGSRRTIAGLGEMRLQSWDSKLRARVNRARAFASGRKPCVRFVLASGQHVELSTDHPVRTKDGWTEAADLDPRDLVATPRWLPEPAEPLRETDERLVLLGCMLMDGGTSQTATMYSKHDGPLLEELRIAVGKLGGSVRTKGKYDHALLGVSKIVNAWGMRGELSKTKRLPPQYYGLATEQIGRLLSIMWSGDGWIHDNGGAMMTLSNRLLLEDVRHLLLRIGVHARIRRNDKKLKGRTFEAWTLGVTGGANIARFLEHVRVIYDRDMEPLRRCAAGGYRSDTDVVPVGRPEMGTIAAETGQTYRRVRDEVFAVSGATMTRAQFAAGCRDLGYVGRYAHLAESDVIWSRVLSVEPIGVHDVYDVEVDEDHNFAAANVIVHNTVAAAYECLALALEPKPRAVGWVVGPTYDLAQKVWRELVYVLHDKLPQLVVKHAEHEGLLVVSNMAGGTCEIRKKSADSPVSLLGEGLDWLVLDEAAQVKSDIWERYLLARLLDKRGRALVISTPKGKGWFYSAWQRGQKRELGYESWNAPTSTNPIISKRELEIRRAATPDLVWRQEYLAEFIEGAGAVFRRVRDLATGEAAPYESSKTYYAGLDLAKTQDYTVLVIVDEDRRVVAWDRFHRVDWTAQVGRIAATLERYGDPLCVVDSTGKGEPIYERLVEGGVRAIGYSFTTASKAALVNNLALMLERGDVTLPRYEVWPELVDELEAFEYTVSAAGNVKSGSPPGQHDDCAIALMLAVWETRGGPMEVLEI